MHAHGAVAYAGSFDLDQPSPFVVRHRRRSVPFLMVSPLVAMLFLVATALTAAVVTVVLAAYLLILTGAVGWGCSDRIRRTSPSGSPSRATRGLNAWISRANDIDNQA